MQPMAKSREALRDPYYRQAALSEAELESKSAVR
jgi:hypothetical protein